jgi:predicted Zn-ribbon and HTH transcriptional regulator
MEEILLQNSKNLTALIHLMKLHEENIARFSHDTENDTDILMKPSLYTECDYSTLITNVKMCPMTRTFFVPTDKVILVRECGHLFKKEAFLEWITSHSTCPRCKVNLNGLF